MLLVGTIKGTRNRRNAQVQNGSAIKIGISNRPKQHNGVAGGFVGKNRLRRLDRRFKNPSIDAQKKSDTQVLPKEFKGVGALPKESNEVKILESRETLL